MSVNVTEENNLSIVQVTGRMAMEVHQGRQFALDLSLGDLVQRGKIPQVDSQGLEPGVAFAKPADHRNPRLDLEGAFRYGTFHFDRQVALQQSQVARGEGERLHSVADKAASRLNGPGEVFKKVAFP